MKKVILSLLGIIAFASVTSAQGFHIGAKAGANLGKINGQDFEDGFKLGYQLGGFAEIDFTKGFGIQPEVLFSQTNTTVTDEPLSGLKPGATYHLNYLSVPILLNLNAGKLLTFQLGPQFSILMNKDDKLTTNVGNAVKSGDLAAVLGARVNLGSLNVFGRYNIGLSKINDIGDQQKWKNQAIQLGLGLKIL